MFKIDPAALYSKNDLTAYLEQEGIDIDHFLFRLKCKKKFRGLWFGEDLIEALRRVSPLSDSEEKTAKTVFTQTPPRTRKTKSETQMIGGTINPSNLGLKTIRQ